MRVYAECGCGGIGVQMKEYFISVIVVSLVGSMVVSMASGNSAAKHLKLLCGLCTVACIVFPLTAAFGVSFDKEDVVQLFACETNEKEYYDEIYNLSLNKSEIKNAENILKGDIVKELSLSKDDFDVNIIAEENNGEFYISTVRINIYTSGISINPRYIEQYILNRLGCGCEFVYEI